MADPTPAAQVTHATHPLLSPFVIGGLVLVVANISSIFGIQILDDPAVQQKLVASIDMLIVLGTAAAHVVWPHKDGRLSFAARFSTPAPVNLPVGAASVVTVPKPSDQAQTATVQPIDVGTQTVKVEPAKAETSRADAKPMAVTIAPIVFPEPLPEPPKPERKKP